MLNNEIDILIKLPLFLLKQQPTVNKISLFDEKRV